MRTKLWHHIVAGVGVLVACGCANTETPVEKSAADVNEWQEGGEAGLGAELAVERCRHEETCGNVGHGRAYATRGACESALVGPTRREVRTCSKFDRVQLDRCTYDIQFLPCADWLDVLARVDSCQATSLCP